MGAHPITLRAAMVLAGLVASEVLRASDAQAQAGPNSHSPPPRSMDGVEWVNPTDGLQTSLRSVTAGHGLFVAINLSGVLVASADGNSWNQCGSGTTPGLRSVTRGAGGFVAVGEAGTIVTSPDGVQWTRCRSATLQTLNSVTYGAGTYIAVGEAGTILASPDGTAWRQVRTGYGEALNAVTVANNRFVAVGSGGRITVSADGIRWVNLNSGTTATFSRISCLRGRSVITGPGPGVIWISQDGLSWSAEPGGCAFVAGPSEGGSVLAIRYQQQLLVPIVTRMKGSNNPAGVPPSSRPSATSGIPQGAGK